MNINLQIRTAQSIRCRRRKGSTLLMALSFLTILAMLGATFFLMSIGHLKLAQAARNQDITSRLAEGVRKNASNQLRDALYFPASAATPLLRQLDSDKVGTEPTDTVTPAEWWDRYMVYPCHNPDDSSVPPPAPEPYVEGVLFKDVLGGDAPKWRDPASTATDDTTVIDYNPDACHAYSGQIFVDPGQTDIAFGERLAGKVYIRINGGDCTYHDGASNSTKTGTFYEGDGRYWGWFNWPCSAFQGQWVDFEISCSGKDWWSTYGIIKWDPNGWDGTYYNWAGNPTYDNKGDKNSEWQPLDFSKFRHYYFSTGGEEEPLPSYITNSSGPNSILSSFEMDKSGNTLWHHISDLSVADIVLTDDRDSNLTIEALGGVELPPGSDPVPLDTDGDGSRDAYIVKNCGVTDTGGHKFYTGTRLIDMSGLVNINTAYDLAAVKSTTTGIPYLVSQPYIQLDGNLGGYFSTVTGTDGTNAMAGASGLLDYYAGCITKLPTPDATYKPFYIENEGYLRWLGGTSFEKGRLHELAENIPAANRKYLTTHSSSFAALRLPRPNNSMLRYNLNQILGKNGYTPSADPQAEIGEIADILMAAAPDNATIKRQILHFLANAWAYADGHDQNKTYNLTRSFDIDGDTSDDIFTAYGVVPQPVLTEAYTKITFENDKDADSDGTYEWIDPPTQKVHAVEIYNPYASHFGSISGAYAYHVIQGNPVDSGSWTMDVDITTNLNTDTYISIVNNSSDAAYFSASGGTVINSANLDHSAGSVSIVRIAVDGASASHTIPVDSINLGGVPLAPEAPTGDTPDTKTAEKIVERDMGTNNKRHLVALQRTKEPDPVDDAPNTQSHTIGTSNGEIINNDSEVDTTIALPDDFKKGFYILRPYQNTGGLVSTGELFGLFMTGPHVKTISTATTCDSLPEGLANGNEGYYKSNTRGMVDYFNTRAGEGKSGNICNNELFPDLPWPMLAGEVLDLLDPDPGIINNTGNPVVYGRININTAPKAVLEKLPWDINWSTAPWNGTEEPSFTIDSAAIADKIIAFRNNPSGFLTDESLSGCLGANSINVNGFMTPSELMIPLEAYLRNNAGFASALNDPNDVEYPLARHYLYKSVANLVTVNSNTFATYIVVAEKENDSDTDYQCTHYLTVIDRSECTRTASGPDGIIQPQSSIIKIGSSTQSYSAP